MDFIPLVIEDFSKLETFYLTESIIVILFNLLFLDNLRTAGKIFFLLFIYNKRKKESNNNYDTICNKRHKNKKRLSILIPAYNEESCIRNSIESAVNTPYPNKEIIVIDDGSTDKTYQIAKEFADKGQIKLFKNKNGGSKSRALNLGFLHATGDVIITIDADTDFVNTNSLYNIMHGFEQEKKKYRTNPKNKIESHHDVSAIAGNVRVLHGDNHITNLLTDLQLFEFLVSMEIGRRFASILNIILVISGGFGAFRRDAFGKVGKFDHDTIGEDFDLTLKIQKLGTKIPFEEQSIVKTSCPYDLRGLVRQRTRWAYAQIQVLLKHRDVIWSSKYRMGLRLGVLHMWIMDVVMNFVWITGIVITILFIIISQSSPESVPHIELSTYLLVFVNYLLLELSLFIFTNVASSKTNPMKLLYLIPIMVFVYRPLLRLVVLRAHVLAILRKPVRW